MNISCHCFLPICQYELGDFDSVLTVNGGTEVSGYSVKRKSLYTGKPDKFDERFSYFDFSGVNSVLSLSVFKIIRPFSGFPNTSYPYGQGVYIPYSQFEDTSLLTGYTYAAAQGADLDSCKTMFISDNAEDCQVRYVFWKEPVLRSRRSRRSILNYVDDVV